jgi:regulatory protein
MANRPPGPPDHLVDDADATARSTAHRPSRQRSGRQGSPAASRPLGQAPDGAGLYDAAVAHLARYATTEAGLRRVLHRRIERWARAAEATLDRDTIAAQVAECLGTVSGVVARLVASGAVSDAEFAASRARSLVRAGRSRLAVTAHLVGKGVTVELARSAAPQNADVELAAALTLARRRRLGPFRTGSPPARQRGAQPARAGETADQAQHRRELGVMARAGFPQEVADRALSMDPDEAEERVLALRR